MTIEDSRIRQIVQEELMKVVKGTGGQCRCSHDSFVDYDELHSNIYRELENRDLNSGANDDV